MTTHVCKRWDTVFAVAALHQISPSQIWDDPANDSLRRRRVYPDALLPNDPLVIPDSAPKRVPSGTGRELELWAYRDVRRYRVQLLLDGEPCAGATCRLENLPDSSTATDTDGRFELFVASGAEGRREHQLVVKLPAKGPRRPVRSRRLRVVFGHVENELDFMQTLLTNLGFHCLEVRLGAAFSAEAPLPRRTEAAFLRFQRVFGPVYDKPSPLRDKSLHRLHASSSDQQAWRQLLARHSQETSVRVPFRWEDKLAPLSHPLYRVFTGPAWNRINILEGPQVFVDAHMHINSGKCAPWPLVWDKNAMLNIARPSHGMARAGVQALLKADARMGGRLARSQPLDFANIGELETLRIAADSVKQNAEAIREVPRLDDDYLSMLVPLPMDMDFAHVDGYERKQLYQAWSERFEKVTVKVRPALSTPVPVGAVPHVDPLPPGDQPDPHDRKVVRVEGAFYSSSLTCLEDDGTLSTAAFWLDEDEFDDFQPYPQQVEDTLAAAAAHPWSLLPLYHYDPRRWGLETGRSPPARSYRYRRVDAATGRLVEAEKTLEGFPRHWSEPFDRYFKPGGPRQFIGIKLYTALGYRPMDPFLETSQRALYDLCSSDDLQLPIVCHCTPGGMYSVERPVYVIKDCERLRGKAARDAELAKRKEQTRGLLRHRIEVNGIDLESERAPSGARWDEAVRDLVDDWGTFWFSEQYVSPWAWRTVLERYPKLRLSLAHFGGDEPPYSHWARAKPPAVREDLRAFGDRATADRELLWDDQLIALALKYENLHIDLSYFELSRANLSRFDSILQTYPELVDKILFGTDWWMIEKSKMTYKQFLASNRKLLCEVNPELWERFACVNPVRFYRLRENAEAIAEGLRMSARNIEGSKNAGPVKASIARGLDVLRNLK